MPCQLHSKVLMNRVKTQRVFQQLRVDCHFQRDERIRLMNLLCFLIFNTVQHVCSPTNTQEHTHTLIHRQHSILYMCKILHCLQSSYTYNLVQFSYTYVDQIRQKFYYYFVIRSFWLFYGLNYTGQTTRPQSYLPEINNLIPDLWLFDLLSMTHVCFRILIASCAQRQFLRDLNFLNNI